MATKEVCLVDANNLCHRMFYAHRNLHTQFTEAPTGVLHGVFTSLQYYLRHFPAVPIFVFDGAKASDGFKSWRHRKFPAVYKKKREPADDIANLYLQMDPLFMMLEASGHKYVGVRGVEADDLIGILAQDLQERYKVWVWSSDRDMLQLTDVATVVRPHKEEFEVTSPGDAIDVKTSVLPNISKFLAFRSLVGDTSDNLPGVRGCGPVKAMKLLGLGYDPRIKYVDQPEAVKAVLSAEDFKSAQLTFGLSLIMRTTTSRFFSEEEQEKLDRVVRIVRKNLKRKDVHINDKLFLKLCAKYELGTVSNLRREIYRVGA